MHINILNFIITFESYNKFSNLKITKKPAETIIDFMFWRIYIERKG